MSETVYAIFVTTDDPNVLIGKQGFTLPDAFRAFSQATECAIWHARTYADMSARYEVDLGKLSKGIIRVVAVDLQTGFIRRTRRLRTYEVFEMRLHGTVLDRLADIDDRPTLWQRIRGLFG